MDILKALSVSDMVALAIFALAWMAYEPLLHAVGGNKGVINTDMTAIRAAWMRTMAARENKFMDGQLLGHTLNSASFFASSNLILIAAAAGVLFGGVTIWRQWRLIESTPRFTGRGGSFPGPRITPVRSEPAGG